MTSSEEKDRLLSTLIDEIRKLSACQQKISRDLSEHISREEETLNRLTKAFPDDDIRGHREYHDALIAGVQQRVKIRQAIIEKSLGGLIWVGMVWVAIAIWQAFVKSIH